MNTIGIKSYQPIVANEIEFSVVGLKTRIGVKFRGWIGGSAQGFYEEGIRASMDQWTRYPNAVAIPVVDQDNYINHPDVVYDDGNALELINTQYWVSNVANGHESFANFRRTGYPALSPNLYNNNLNGGFMRRFSYPNTEAGQNETNHTAAAAAIGGNNLTSRVFWDIAQ